MRRPVLILGTMRSGTTLLGRILNAHPQLFINYNQSNFLRYYSMNFSWKTNKENFVMLIEKIRHHTISNKKSFSEEQKNQIVEFLDKNGYTYQNMYCALALLVFKAEKNRWGEKYAGDCREAEYFFDMYPEGQVIQIIRDPRDVFASNKKRTSDMESLESKRRDIPIIEDWKRSAQQAIKYSEHFGNNSYFVVKYENIVTNPEQVTKQICQFLKIEWSRKMIEPEGFVDDTGSKWEANTSFEKISGIGTNAISRYGKALTSNEIVFVEQYLKNEMNMMGYKITDSKIDNQIYQEYVQKMKLGFLAQGRYKIAFFINSLEEGNVALASFLHQSYHDPLVITTIKKESHKFNLATLLPKKKFFHKYYDWEELSAIFSNNDFDFIHLNGEQFLDAEMFEKLKNKYNLRVFLTNGKNTDPSILSICDKIIANSNEEKNYFEKIASPSKIHLINNDKLFAELDGLYYSFVLENKILK